jgi:hypothetical protein
VRPRQRHVSENALNLNAVPPLAVPVPISMRRLVTGPGGLPVAGLSARMANRGVRVLSRTAINRLAVPSHLGLFQALLVGVEAAAATRDLCARDLRARFPAALLGCFADVSQVRPFLFANILACWSGLAVFWLLLVARSCRTCSLALLLEAVLVQVGPPACWKRKKDAARSGAPTENTGRQAQRRPSACPARNSTANFDVPTFLRAE